MREESGIIAYEISAKWTFDKGIAKDLSYAFNIDSNLKKRQQMTKVSNGFHLYALVINEHDREQQRYSKLFSELDILFRTAKSKKLSVKPPRIGCGSGGLDWDVVYHMLVYLSSYYDVPVKVIDHLPFETFTGPSNIEAMEKYLAHLEDRGTAIVRLMGVNNQTLVIVQRLARGFRKIACWRSPTTPNT